MTEHQSRGATTAGRARRLILALCAVAVTALIGTASASAAWLENGKPLESEATMGLDGTFQFEAALGGIECEVSTEANLDPSNPSNPTATLSSLIDSPNDCETFGALEEFFECEVTSATTVAPFKLRGVHFDAPIYTEDDIKVVGLGMKFVMNKGCLWQSEAPTFAVGCFESPTLLAVDRQAFDEIFTWSSATCAFSYGPGMGTEGVYPDFTLNATPAGAYGLHKLPKGTVAMRHEDEWMSGPETQTFSGLIGYTNGWGGFSCEASVDIGLRPYRAEVTDVELDECWQGGLFPCEFVGGEAQNLPWEVSYANDETLEFSDTSVSLTTNYGCWIKGVDIEGDFEAAVDSGAITSLELGGTVQTSVGESEVAGTLYPAEQSGEYGLSSAE